MATQKVNIDIQTKGAKKSKEELSGLNSAISKVGKAAGIASAAYFGAKGLISAFSSVIEASARQEAAEKALEVALGRTSQSLLNQASALQQVTTAGDESIIEQQAFLASLKFTEDQIKTIIPVALDLSAATGISLESAVRNTSKTFSGLAGELGELVPQLRDLTQEEMKAGKAVEVLGNLFEGQASKQTETLAGSIQQMSNAVGDAAESIGSLLAPTVIRVADGIKFLAEGVGTLISRFKDFGKEVDILIEGPNLAKIQIDNFRESIKNLSVVEIEQMLNALNKQNSALTMVATATKSVMTMGTLQAESDQVQIEKAEILFERHKELISQQGLSKEMKTDLIDLQQREIDTTQEFINHLDSLTAKEKMSNEERLANRRQFSELMSQMFASDFDSQRLNLGKQITAFREAGVLEADIARFTAEQKKQIRVNEIEFQASSISQLIGGLGQLNEASAGSAKVNARLAQVQAIIDTYAGANKAFAQGGVFGFATGAAIIASGLANVLTISRNIGDLEKFNTGGIVPGTGNTDSVPALLTPGEVILNQAQQQNVAQGLGGGINIEINAPLVDETVIDTIIPAIQKAQKLNLA
jgi:hypothetical protein